MDGSDPTRHLSIVLLMSSSTLNGIEPSARGRFGGCGVDLLLQNRDAGQHRIQGRDLTEDHPGHGCVITPEYVVHCGVGGQRECACSRRVQSQVWATEEQSGVCRTVGSKFVINQPDWCSLRLHQSMDVVIVTRYPLALVSQFVAAVIPLAQTVQDDDLVPERSLWPHRRYVPDREVQTGQIVRYVWDYCRGDVRVQRRLGASFDFDGGANVVAFGRRDCGIPEQQRLTVLVVGVCLQSETSFRKRGRSDFGELSGQRTGDIALAGIADGVKAGAALFAAERIQVCRFDALTQVIEEDRDVDVLGEPGDKPEGLRQGCAALEQPPRAASG